MLPNIGADIFIWPKYDSIPVPCQLGQIKLGMNSDVGEQIATPVCFKSFSRSVSCWLKGSRTQSCTSRGGGRWRRWRPSFFLFFFVFFFLSFFKGLNVHPLFISTATDRHAQTLMRFRGSAVQYLLG